MIVSLDKITTSYNHKTCNLDLVCERGNNRNSLDYYFSLLNEIVRLRLYRSFFTDIFTIHASLLETLQTNYYLLIIFRNNFLSEPPIRSDLVEQLPYVAMICQDTPHLFGDVLHNHILGIIRKYLLDTDNQVSKIFSIERS